VAVWAVVQHVAFEGPGLISLEAHSRGMLLAVTRRDRGDPLPPVDEVDGLIMMGGPMGADEVRDEWPLIAAAVRRGLPVLGVCLGAQVLAAALGGRVYRGPHPEVGHGSVRVLTDDPVLGPVGGVLPVFHWHHDTFELPPGAVHLAASDLYEHQAFRFGPLAYGLQFHVEVDEALAEAWRSRLPPGVEVEAPPPGSGRALLGKFLGLAS
jgi:GMP synthase-like glutamine amidotransferase